jgi:hypothetical protein
VTDPRIDTHLTKKIEALKLVQGPQERSLCKSLFMVATATFAETGLITHDQRFEWNEKMLREVP